MFLPEQIAGWKKVTDVVHAKGGKIFAQREFNVRRAPSDFDADDCS